MSLVYITHHNENVYDFEQSGFFATPMPNKRLKYVSKHKAHVKKQIHQSYITEDPNGVKLITDWGKHERRTMGCAHTPLNPPKCFLRKNEGLKWRRLHEHVCPPPKGLEPVPKRSQMPKKPCGPQRKTPRGKQEKQDKLESAIATDRSVKSSKTTREKQPKQDSATLTDRSAKSTKSAREKNPKQEKEQKLQEYVNPCETCESERERQKQEKVKTLVDPCITDWPAKSEISIKPSVTNRSVKSDKSSKLQKKRQGSSGLTDRSDKLEKTMKSPQPDRRCKRINFIALNRKRAIEAKTKRPPPHFVDTPLGNRQNLLNSGLIPQFVCGRNFAKVPCYINEHKKMLQELRAACTKEQVVVDPCSKYMSQHGVRKMSIEERVALLEGLKTNYLEQLKIFQALSLYTDTPTKKLRKGRLEKDLQQLEIDIHFLADNPEIYIADF